MNLLYYPYINLPDTEWTIRTLLYYDNVSSIVPTQYFHEPERYEPFMREAVQNELITPVNPMNVLDNPWEVTRMFDEYLNQNKGILKRRRLPIQRNGISHIHAGKILIQGKWGSHARRQT